MIPFHAISPFRRWASAFWLESALKQLDLPLLMSAAYLENRLVRLNLNC